MNLLRIVLILLTIYFLFKLVVRVLLPYLIKGYVEKKSKEFQDRYNHQHRKPEGEITIETKDKSKSRKGKSSEDGEYVDYEEIKD